MAALIIQDDHTLVYPGSSWQFLTPPVKSVYDDYGSIELDQLTDEDRAALDLFMRMWKPALKLDKQYPNKSLENKTEWSLDDLWNGCYHGDLRFDPNRERRQEIQKWQQAGCPEESKPVSWWSYRSKYPIYDQEEEKVAAWMCHKSVWDYLTNIYSWNIDEEELDRIRWTSNLVSQTIKQKFGETSFTDKDHPNNEAASQFWYDKISRDCYSITGRQGAFYSRLRQVILYSDNFDPELNSAINENPDFIKEYIRRTVRTVKNMLLVRKNILPMSSCGEQYDSFEYLPKWTAMIATKCVELSKRYE